MNKKLFKAVVCLAVVSVLALSTVTGFAAIATTTTSAYDFSTGKVTVTTSASGLETDKMITYLLSTADKVTSGDQIIFIDQKTVETNTVEFTCKTTLDALESATAVLKMGSNAGYEFTTDDSEFEPFADATAGVVEVNSFVDTNGNLTFIGKVVADAADGFAYGATLSNADGSIKHDIYAVGAEVDGETPTTDVSGKPDLSAGNYYAITVEGLEDTTGWTLSPLFKTLGE